MHIGMIFEWSFDIEDRINGCGKFSFAIRGINYILKYINLKKNSYYYYYYYYY